jgi:hypothetical protein
MYVLGCSCSGVNDNLNEISCDGLIVGQVCKCSRLYYEVSRRLRNKSRGEGGPSIWWTTAGTIQYLCILPYFAVNPISLS